MTKEFNTKHTADEPDLLDMLGAMTKGQRDMFLLIKVNMDYRTNRAVLGNADLTPSQVNQRSAAYNGLHKLGLIKRVRQGDLTNLAGEKISVSKGTYMVNPTYIRPRDKYAEELFYQWHQLK